MKKVLVIMGMVIMTIVVVTLGYNQLFAVSGCCKERSSLNGNWVINNMSYQQCRQNNDQRDRDNLFERRGYVWWDAGCR